MTHQGLGLEFNQKNFPTRQRFLVLNCVTGGLQEVQVVEWSEKGYVSLWLDGKVEWFATDLMPEWVVLEMLQGH